MNSVLGFEGLFFLWSKVDLGFHNGCNFQNDPTIYTMKRTRLLLLARTIALPFIGYVIYKHSPSTETKYALSLRPHILHPVLPCVKVSGKLCIPHCFGPPSRNWFLVHRSKVGSTVAGCIGAHLERGKVMSVEHVLSWSLGSKELPLPLPFNYQIISQQAFCSDKDYFILKLY